MDIVKKVFVIASCVAVFSSCSNDKGDVIEDDVKVQMSFGVSAGTSNTRAYLPNFPTSKDIYWKNTDCITVFASGHEYGDKFDFDKFVNGVDPNSATFNGMSYANASEYYFLYPAQSKAKLTSEGIRFNVPAVQTATRGSFDPNAGIQIGKGTIDPNVLIGLNNVCAYFYLTVRDKCQYVYVEATNTNWHLAGTCTADYETTGSGGVLIKSFENDCTNKIELTGFPEQGGTYFLAFIPTSQAQTNFRVTVGYDNSAEYGGVENLEIESASGFNFTAGACYNLGSF